MTAIRLVGAGPTNAFIRDALTMTTVRLVGSSAIPSPFFTEALQAEEPTTTVRLVGATDSTTPYHVDSALSRPAERQAPALLVSYFYWRQFELLRPRYHFRDYLLDSGAFSAYNSGKTIVLAEYADFCLAKLEQDPQCVEVIALDVMRDWREGQRNTEYLWKRGVPAIPVYHYGEPVSLLMEYAAASPKVCIGTGQHFGDNPTKLKFAEAVFARVWPKKIHGLQFLSEPLMMALPFHSVDSSSWERGPAQYGNYRSMGKPHRAPRAKAVKLRAELEWYLALERRVSQRWRREMALLEATNPLGRTRAIA